MRMQSISKHEVKKIIRGDTAYSLCINAPDIGSGGSTRCRVAAASMSQISRPLWMLG